LDSSDSEESWVGSLQESNQYDVGYSSWVTVRPGARHELFFGILLAFGFIFSGTSIAGPASSLTTKANSYFVSLDSITNSPWLHIDMNFDSPFLVGFGGGGGMGFMTILLPS